MKGFISEGPRTANGLREGDVDIIMERRVEVWARTKAKLRQKRLRESKRKRRGPRKKGFAYI